MISGSPNPDPSLHDSGILFGVYPGGAAGSHEGLASGPCDDPERIRAALDLLQPADSPFLVRVYTHFSSKHGPPLEVFTRQLRSFSAYTSLARKLDLVFAYRDESSDIDGFTAFLRDAILLAAPMLAKVQIVEEPNLPFPPGDGCFPAILEAVASGVVAARRAVDSLGLPIQVGFNAVQQFQPAMTFWTDLAPHLTPDFLAALDYVGIDAFPDVFRPLEDISIEDAVAWSLRNFRFNELPQASIGSQVPIHVTEYGWPTGKDRSEHRQAQILESVVRTVASLRHELNITHFEWFSLRDADSAQPGPFHHFGLLDSGYAPKPAFHSYARLIHEFSRGTASGGSPARELRIEPPLRPSHPANRGT